MPIKKFKIVLIIGIIFLSLPLAAGADEWSQKKDFFIDSFFDASGREKLTATLQARSLQLYFYIDDSWWNTLTGSQQDEARKSFNFLITEFETKIYPALTSTFGSEDKPGIDKDERITVLIHPIIDRAGGYFRNIDGYSKFQASTSNEREMVYLNSQYVNDSRAPGLLSHEFSHLINLNQKEKKYDVSEDIWLNEARAEYSPTLLGYDEEYKNSNLEARVKSFLSDANNSLTDWQGKEGDYGVINLFTQYLVDQYGLEILISSLKSPKVGILSIDYALEKNGFKEDFSQVFTNWTIANLVNDCSIGGRYCYKNKNLKNFKIVPLTNYLPLVGEISLKFGNATQPFSGNWQRFIGGRGKLTLQFEGSSEVNFKVPYFLETVSGGNSVEFLELSSSQKGNLTLSDFGKEITSLTIIPTIQSKTKKIDDSESYFLFSWTASVTKENQTSEVPSTEKPISQMTKTELETKIIEIQKQIITLLTQLIQLLQAQITQLR